MTPEEQKRRSAAMARSRSVSRFAVANGDDSLVQNDLDRLSLSFKLGVVGLWDRAESVARSITRRDDREEALAGLARQLAEADHVEHALEIVEAIDDAPEIAGAEKTVALIAIAAKYGDRGDRVQAADVLKRALRSALRVVPRDFVLDFLVDISRISVAIGGETNARNVALMGVDLAPSVHGMDVEKCRVRLGKLLIDLHCKEEITRLLQIIGWPWYRKQLEDLLTQ